ncbi:MAG: hypothetical protein KGS09_05975 [Nitrospirae bacterium]|nr:hypothetical protein [Nitrospirota bacterium]MDE3040831.1 hypothetical protein [Nitrospirota bacterium]
MIGRQRNHAGRHLALLGLLLCMSRPFLAHAVPMVNDPNGFQNLSWGTTLTARPDLEVTRGGQHVNEYQLRDSPPLFAGIPVESVRFLSVDEQFARVTIRYQGDDRHRQILTYLEQQFGSIERVPGQMMRGLNQQYNWRGTDTEINLTYHANTQRGFIFIDSRTLAPRFNDQMADSAD